MLNLPESKGAGTFCDQHIIYFNKSSFSSFHLSRDYRERFQLTNVFLALLHDGDVKCDDQVKQIVMQSLFSRSDTGLLKGEHSFAMPGVSELLKPSNT